MIELEKRECIIFKCSNEFKVMKESEQITCSMFCLEEYSVYHRRLRAYRGVGGNLGKSQAAITNYKKRARLIDLDFGVK